MVLNEHNIDISSLLAARKGLGISANTKMKQLQWDKLSQQHTGNTVFGAEDTEKENDWIKKFQKDGIWQEMEDDFKAKQLVINLMAKQKRAELKSVLDPQTKKSVEILMNRVKKLEPEEIARKIELFDPQLCTDTFLSELKRLLPTPEQVGKLNVHRNASPEELAELHPADRLMVKLIQLDRLPARVDAMLFMCTFEESWKLLNKSTHQLIDANQDLMNSANFKELLSLILLIGNYMNGTGVKGGAFGFRVSSINKLVDTKSVNNTTLLHFLEKTVSRHFRDMERFLEELDRPAEAYRVNLLEVRRDLTELRTGFKRLRDELKEHHTNVDPTEFARQMRNFANKAERQLEDLVDDVNAADAAFKEVVRFYGEDEKMTSSEFYGIFKTFVTSYKKCQGDNRAIAQERLAAEKRKQTEEEAKANRLKTQELGLGLSDDNRSMVDDIMAKLRNGEVVRRRKGRPSDRPTVTDLPQANPIIPTATGDETADLAMDMLARLQSDGFKTFQSVSPSSTTPKTRRTRRARATTEAKIEKPIFALVDESSPPQTPDFAMAVPLTPTGSRDSESRRRSKSFGDYISPSIPPSPAEANLTVEHQSTSRSHETHDDEQEEEWDKTIIAAVVVE